MASGAALWMKVRKLVATSNTIDAVVKSKRDHATSSGQLLASGHRPYRPVRLPCDLRRHSPLVAIFKGVSPSEVLRSTELGPIAFRSGFVGRAEPAASATPARGTTLCSSVRQSAPGVGSKTRLGGGASFRALQPTGLIERSHARLAAYEDQKRFEDVTMSIFEHAIQAKCVDIDQQRDAKMQMPAPQLADYALELADQVLHPGPTF